MEITNEGERVFGDFVARAHSTKAACASSHSSRLIEHVCTKSDVVTEEGIHIQSSYKQQLRIWGRRRFDMFSRPSVSPKIQDDLPTLAKMNFDLWSASIKLHECVSLHESELKQSMKEYRVSAKRLKCEKPAKENNKPKPPPHQIGLTIFPGEMSIVGP